MFLFLLNFELNCPELFFSRIVSAGQEEGRGRVGGQGGRVGGPQ